MFLDDDGTPGVSEAGSSLLAVAHTEVAGIVRLLASFRQEAVYEGVAGIRGGDGETDLLQSVDKRSLLVAEG